MTKRLLPLISSVTLALAAAAACTIGDPDPTSGDGDGMGGAGDGDGDAMGGAGDGDGDAMGGAGTGGDGTGGATTFASCDDENGGCDELCDDDGGEVTCSCLPGAKLGQDQRSCQPIDVLYLGDGGFNSDDIYDRLIVEGYNVVDAAPFSDWDGEMPALDDFDVVVLIQGFGPELGLTETADGALSDWMLAGGTVIRSEWIAYQIALDNSTVADQTGFNQYLPVESLDAMVQYSAEWIVTDPAHPLTAGLDGSWMNADGGCSELEPMPNAVVVAEADVCGPALTYKTFGDDGGMVIHINDDFGQDGGGEADPDPVTLNILVNAINFGAM